MSAKATLPFVTKFGSDGVALANENIDRMATMSADEASHWDLLHAGHEIARLHRPLKRAIPKPDDIFVLHAAPLDQAHTALHARALQPFPNDLRAQIIQRNADAPVAVAKRRAFADPAPMRATLAGNLRQIVAASAT